MPKYFKIYVLIFLGLLLLTLPMGGISVFQPGRWWWIYNIVLMAFGGMLLPLAIEWKSYRWAMLAMFIIFVAGALFFIAGPFLSEQVIENANQGL